MEELPEHRDAEPASSEETSPEAVALTPTKTQEEREKAAVSHAQYYVNNIMFMSEEERRLAHLNSYAFYPNTVPPFVLEEQFERARKVTTDEPSSAALPPESTAAQWEQFAHKIGSNVAYADDRRVNVRPSAGAMGARMSRAFTASSNVSMSTSASSLDEEEKARVRKEVLQDLSADWGGEERLKALYNLPMQTDFKFKTRKDRNEWVTYVSRAKEIYYGNGNGNGNKEPQQLRMGSDGSSRGNDLAAQSSTRNMHIDWLEDFNADKEKWRKLRDKKMKKWMPKLSRLLIENQYLPLTFRIIITILSVASLALAVRIFQNSDERIAAIDSKVPQQASTIMAICVNSIAVFYTIYIAADEFSGQPIGLRNPLSKLKLILLDLLFIIFSSANLALAFNTRYDREWVCTTDYTENGLYKYPRISYICRKQKALSSFLFVLLFMWVVVFIISIIRVVKKVSSNSSRN
ncbi:Srf1 protein [Maudiozyma humilis]|uniref:Srf1 protein n=1 Tax=Maudiozyma humilis TaxID=51915 RepID=A0AAV5RVX0_MAUHU|nr:Srf1 protein [Kazachstania humilis]